MVETFAAQLFLLIGIDIFLGGGILTVVLDRHFPEGLPYVLELGAFIGFAQLVAGKYYETNFSDTIIFYTSFAYSIIALLSVASANAMLLLRARRVEEETPEGSISPSNLTLAGSFAIVATVPSLLVNLFFASAYVNGLSLELPWLPSLPISTIFVLFVLSAAIMLLLLIGVAYSRRKSA